MLITLLVLIFLGLCFGSFVNAFTWRLHEGKDWVKARSECPKCGHELAPKDLVPLLSWLSLHGRCRYCKQSISWQYPLVEVAMAAIFALSYVFWPQPANAGEYVLLVTWLASSILLLALAIYDLKWMLLPNKLIYPTLAIAAAGNTAFLILYEHHKLHFLISWLGSVLVASGIFFILFTVSRGRWIGFGDVRLGLVTGTLLHSAGLALLMIFLASAIGTLIVLPMLVTGRKNMSAKLPYGPMLIAATFFCLLWGGDMISWYRHLFLP